MTSGQPIPQTVDIAATFLADVHRGQSFHLDRVITGLQWALAQRIPPSVIVDLGDSNHDLVREMLAEEFPEYTGAYIKVCGNHDGNVPVGAPTGTTPAEPFSNLLAAFPDLFQGCEWWRHDMRTLDGRPTHVRFLGLNNCTPYTDATGKRQYAEVNPPGEWWTDNPDHTGLTIAGSPQRVWLQQQLAEIGDAFTIVCAHRGWYTHFDSDPRREAYETRFLCDLFEAAGVSQVWTGDKHVGSLARLPGKRITYGGLAGGYFVRTVGGDAVPPGALLWSSGATMPASGLCHVAHLEFQGDAAPLRIFQCSNADPVGAVVYTETLNRNGGVAGSLIEQ